MLFHKDKTGQQWFLGVYSNNFEDKEEETFSWDAHLEYTQWMRDKGIKLPVTIAHQPQYPDEIHLAQLIGLEAGIFTPQEFSDNYMKMYKPHAFAQTEAVIPSNGFMLVVAKILKGKENTVKLLSKSGWGMSHGFAILDRDENTLTKYRSFEFTSLPTSLVANKVTFSSIQENDEPMAEMKGFTEEERDLLKQALNATTPEELEEATKAAQDVLKKVLDSKSISEDEVEEAAEEEEVVEVQATEDAPYEEIRDKIFSDLGVDQLLQTFKQVGEMLQKFDTRLEDVESRVQVTEKSDDEKIADAFYVPDWNTWNSKSIPESDEDLDEEAIKEKAIKEGASIEGVVTTPNTDNPMYLGWMQHLNMGAQ